MPTQILVIYPTCHSLESAPKRQMTCGFWKIFWNKWEFNHPEFFKKIIHPNKMEPYAVTTHVQTSLEQIV